LFFIRELVLVPFGTASGCCFLLTISVLKYRQAAE
jgi:hypothetical protein